MDLPGFPTQVYNGTVWTHVGPWKRTTFTVNSTNIPTSASDGTGSRAVATMSMNAEAYDRRMKVFVQTSVNSGAIASGISRWDVCASLMQSQASNAQTRSPLCWTAPGNYLMSSYIETEEIIVPANSLPIRASGWTRSPATSSRACPWIRRSRSSGLRNAPLTKPRRCREVHHL
ncbi:hypothetical protein [Arthrobacter woluwensis]|uniref:Uncharacterized protein n=1 Tax=Arthrobacter woluwensis TaxID=156980 RepID=A0A1H4X0L8_9MICC|nr:hypothetical protein [Arthrobacter woluwensis]SEC99107.1 hypothetical protein SAMN04489745_3634 [Arthrobacter woluwensis]